MASIYTSEYLLAMVRTKLGDETTPYLVEDSTILNALDVSQKEFAERTLCLRDTELLTIDVVAGEVWYKLSDIVVKVRNSWLQGARREVVPVTKNEAAQGSAVKDYGFQGRSGNWWRTSTGTPEIMITDLREGYIRLSPEPTANDTLELSSYNYPRTLDDNLTANPQIPDRWRQSLIYGALARIYEIEDTELYDNNSAQRMFQKWEMDLARAEAFFLKKNRGATTVQFNSKGVW